LQASGGSQDEHFVTAVFADLTEKFSHFGKIYASLKKYF